MALNNDEVIGETDERGNNLNIFDKLMNLMID